MAARTGRFRTVGAFRSVFANDDLRRVELAYLLFEMAKWGTRVAILVVAYQQGGATETGLVATIQLVPAAIVAPLASVVGDRMRRDRALLLGDAVQTVAAGSVAAALYWEAPIGLVYAAGRRRGRERDVDTAGAVGAVPSAGPIDRRARGGERRGRDYLQRDGARGPGGIRSPDRADGPALALGVFAGLHLGATLLVVGLRPEPQPPPSRDRPVREALAGFRELAHQPNERLVMGLLVGQSMISGALEIVLVVVAVRTPLPPSLRSGPTYRRSGGGRAARRTLGDEARGQAPARCRGRPWASSSTAWGRPRSAFAATVVLTATFLVVAGTGHARADVAGRILLQRVVPDRILARVFGVLEGAKEGGAAVGAALTPLLVAALGLRGGILAAGLLLPIAVILLTARIRAVDRSVELLEQEVTLLQSLDLFAPLTSHTLEGIATRLTRVAATPGGVLMGEGDPGDRFYIVADGELELSRDGRAMAKLGPGSYFGEIALLTNHPRTATVTASTPATLLALDRVRLPRGDHENAPGPPGRRSQRSRAGAGGVTSGSAPT